MAVDVCPEISSLAVSPRISFSHDLRDADPSNNVIITRSDALLLESIDFNFCISPDVLSSADELFADGKILPAVVKKSSVANAAADLRSKPISPHLRSINPVVTEKKSLKEFLSLNLDSDAETEPREEKAPAPAPAGKPFWQFRRSSSLNFDHYKSNNTLLRSLHFLSRSYSTGSAPNSKTTTSSASSTTTTTSVPPNIMRKSSSSSSSSSTRTYPSSSYKRTPSRKNYGNGVRIIPVLNIPHACGTVNLFGLGSLFCNGKSKKKKKCNH